VLGILRTADQATDAFPWHGRNLAFCQPYRRHGFDGVALAPTLATTVGENTMQDDSCFGSLALRGKDSVDHEPAFGAADPPNAFLRQAGNFPQQA